MDNKERVSPFTVIELLVLLFGTVLSIIGTVKTLQYTQDYVWCFAFAVIGIILTAVLVANRKKRYAVLTGLAIVFIYLITAGFGYIVCSVNVQRIRRAALFEGKTVTVSVDGREYLWNGSMEYNSEDFSPVSGAAVYVDGKEHQYAVYRSKSSDSIYVEIDSRNTGDYLVMDAESNRKGS